jgi:hypothetical protein
MLQVLNRTCEIFGEVLNVKYLWLYTPTKHVLQLFVKMNDVWTSLLDVSSTWKVANK